jgi:hypothetical protein
MHEALAIIYNTDHFHQTETQKRFSLGVATRAFLDAYPVQLDPADKAKTRDNGIKALEFYVGHYAFEDLKHRVLEVEQLDHDEDWALQLDMVTENTEHGGIYGWDHKITGGKDSKYLGETWWRRYEIDHQVTQYIDQIAKKYGQCDGFYINAIGMGYRQRAYKGEPAGAWFRFGRQMFNRTNEQVEQEWWSVDRTIEEIEESRRLYQLGVPSHRAYGFNTSSCTYCEYRPVCAAGWSWDRDAELITLQYRRVCNRVITEGSHAGHRCTLDRDHQGACDDRPAMMATDGLEDVNVEV